MTEQTAECGQVAQATIYGDPYRLVCQLHPEHLEAMCQDIDQGVSFRPCASGVTA